MATEINADKLEAMLETALAALYSDPARAMNLAATICKATASSADSNATAIGSCAHAFRALANDELATAETHASTALNLLPRDRSRARVIASQLLGRVLLRQGRIDEAAAHYEQEAGRAASAGDEQTEAIFLTMTATAQLVRGGHAAAIPLLQRATATFRRGLKPTNAANALFALSHAYAQAGLTVAAVEAVHASASICRELEHTAELGKHLSVLACRLAEARRPDLAYAPAHEAAEICRAIDDPRHMLSALWTLADVYVAIGDMPAAAQAAKEQWNVAGSLSSPVLRAGARRCLALTAFGCERYHEAAEHARVGLALAQHCEASGEAVDCQLVLAEVALRAGRPDESMEFLRLAVDETHGREDGRRMRVLELLARVQEERGQTCEIDEVREARSDLMRKARDAERDIRLTDLVLTGPTPDSMRLTERQREVMTLLARGMTLQAAGEVLGISARTIRFHKQRIMERRGITSDAGLILLAARMGLAPDADDT